MKVIAASIASLVLLTTAASAQQAAQGKEKAPKGCIPCEALCDWCASLGLRTKDTAAKCREGCRSWGSMVGLKTVYVQKQRHLCKASSFAPRCN